MTAFRFDTTHIGSVPHITAEAITPWLLDNLDIPAWPQFPRRDFRENMYIQFSPSLPAIVIDETKQKVYFDTQGDMPGAMETFYGPVIADNVDAFKLHPEYAKGFYELLDMMQTRDRTKSPTQGWVKGQVTGPISFGLTVTEQNLRASLYNETLLDAIVKNVAFTARWQIRQLKTLRPNVLLSVDEPYMASVGSAFINLNHEQVVAMLDEVFDAIHAEGALAAVHCCGNTDWSILMATKADILNIDAYSYLESLSLYPAELRAFLDRGGAVCWGIVPNTDRIFEETGKTLSERLLRGFALIADKAAARNIEITPEELSRHSLLAPACGLGSATLEIAVKTFDELLKTGEILRKY